MFYYPWFPEAWKQAGVYPYTNYNPSLGFYDGSSADVVRTHIAAMQYGGVELGISSWWGQGHRTDVRVPMLLSAASGTGFNWSVYYEQEGSGDPSVDQIRADLNYLKNNYASDPAYLKIDGKFVVFVWAQSSDGCGMADRWKQANTVGAYVVLKVFNGFKDCQSQPDSWHQYGPAVAASSHAPYSYSISPGFWKVGEQPRLGRAVAAHRQLQRVGRGHGRRKHEGVGDILRIRRVPGCAPQQRRWYTGSANSGRAHANQARDGHPGADKNGIGHPGADQNSDGYANSARIKWRFRRPLRRWRHRHVLAD
jgi:hypothetical protein